MNQAYKKVVLVSYAIVAAALIAFLAFQRQESAHPGAQPEAAQPNAARDLGQANSSDAATLQTWRNVGKAYYEQGKYPQAVAEFQKVVKSGHAAATDYLDLGLAYTQANDLNQALSALTTARQMAPRLTAVDYNLGIVYKRELHYGPAEEAFKKVLASDPNDPATLFNLGTVYFAERKLEPALDAHERLNKMGFERGQNFYVASLFRTFTILVRLGRRDEAQKMLKLHQEYSDKVPNISLQSPALEKGKYGAVLVPASPPVQVAGRAAARPVDFRDITSELGISSRGKAASENGDAAEIQAADYSPDFAETKLLPRLGSSIVVGDYDGDSHPDLYVVNPGGSNQLFHNSGAGTFADVTARAGVEGPGHSVSATFADYDNSGNLSLFVAGLGGVHLYKNNGKGTFTDVTGKAGLKPTPGEVDTCALLFDADNDGLLDLVVASYTNLNDPPHQASFRFPDNFPPAAIHFYSNNGNGTFTDITEAAGLGSVRGRFRSALFADFDGNTYSDLVFFRDDGPPVFFANLGGDKFADRSREAGADFSKLTAVGGAVADFDHDGSFDLALWTTAGYQVLKNNGNARFTPFPNLAAIKPPAPLLSFRGLTADIDGNSYKDLLVADSAGKLHLLANRLGRFHEEPLHLPISASVKLASLGATWIGKPGVLDLVGATRSGTTAAWARAGTPEHWLEISMEGSKSNKQGVGSEVELKQGNFYDKVLISGGPLYVYTGSLSKLDVVRATWPTQIVQNNLAVATDAPLRFRESERLASSCPMLYAWNGSRFVFVTDVLGVGPLGELAPDGTRIKPYSREFVRLPDTIEQRGGSYEFQMTDELREVDYFDRLRLLAVDHPAGEKIYADEIYSSALSEPQLYAVNGERLPVSAVDSHGNSVLPLISKADHRYPHSFERLRIPGMARLHSLTLDLGNLPQAGRISLWLTGWVFWTDSNGSRALMHDSGTPMVSPYVQVRDRQGKWVTVIPDMGLPSGTNRTLRVDLTGKFLSADHHVRIVTNLCVYWDRIFFTSNDRVVQPDRAILPEYADLHYRGFSTPATDPTHVRPDHYEYASLLSHAPWNPMRGFYTRYGSVGKLVGRADNQLVVMSTGDEMTVRFSAGSFPPPRQGWVRSFFLDATGYAKDGEPNTAYSATVAPLPFHAMKNYPPGARDRAPDDAAYREYLRKYQTRPSYRLIPSLAPPVN
ncbi:MAG TPA: FG-GAP-like repeat-containing protein [Terriglobia bacterium]|nr:FG-GAP-like repeat-containing protein [Terriglobia bacterium]